MFSTMKSGPGCPICEGPRKPEGENRSFPFCGPRCKLADLGNWLGGKYALGAEPAGEDDIDAQLRKLN